jgi:hypothetical protein
MMKTLPLPILLFFTQPELADIAGFVVTKLAKNCIHVNTRDFRKLNIDGYKYSMTSNVGLCSLK